MLTGEFFKEYVKSLSAVYDTEEATRIAEWVLETVLNIPYKELGKYSGIDITHEQKQKLKEYLVRLMMAEPVQYVLGFSYFRDLLLKVNKHVLIPRPETEELVQLVIQNNPHFQGTLLDIGTGSGCIGITLAKNLPKAVVYASDVSPQALQVADENARDHAISCHFIRDSILHPIFQKYPDALDIIVSNPPYIGTSEAEFMHANVLNYEPHLALFADQNPLKFYEAILSFGKNKLAKNGKVFLELNPLYANEVADIYSAAGFSGIQIHTDLSAKKRFLSGIY